MFSFQSNNLQYKKINTHVTSYFIEASGSDIYYFYLAIKAFYT